jgi:hypothetical protein
MQASPSMRPPAVSPMVRGARPPQLATSHDSPAASGSTGSSSVTGPQVLSFNSCLCGSPRLSHSSSLVCTALWSLLSPSAPFGP